MISCPDCHASAKRKSKTSLECNTCGRVFHPSQGFIRALMPHRQAKKKKAEPVKAPKGQPAGKITIQQYRWGSTRLW